MIDKLDITPKVYPCALAGISAKPSGLAILKSSIVVPFMVFANDHDEACRRADEFKDNYLARLAEEGPASFLEASWQAWVSQTCEPLHEAAEPSQIASIVAAAVPTDMKGLTESSGCPDLS